MTELTYEQHAHVERLTNYHHLVMVDWPEEVKTGHEGLVELTPCRFCPYCGGDGIDPDSYDDDQLRDCPGCHGRGGIVVTHPPVYVLPSGMEVVAGA